MQDAKLVAMANQIAGYFRAYPPEQAAAGIRKHLLAFWTPAMVDSLRTLLREPVDGIDELVLAAMTEHVRKDVLF